jgi:hypothetical protein
MSNNIPLWIQGLLALDTFTAEQAGEAAGCIVGADAITRLRQSKKVVVEVVGDDGSPYRRKLYRLREGHTQRSPESVFPPMQEGQTHWLIGDDHALYYRVDGSGNFEKLDSPITF